MSTGNNTLHFIPMHIEAILEMFMINHVYEFDIESSKKLLKFANKYRKNITSLYLEYIQGFDDDDHVPYMWEMSLDATLQFLDDDTLRLFCTKNNICLIDPIKHKKLPLCNKPLSESVKKQIAGKQRFKCANNPHSNLKYLSDYDCPLWRNSGDGCFDEAGYEIDHILEQALGGSHDVDNLQALCQSCHKLKTKRFLNKVSGS